MPFAQVDDAQTEMFYEDSGVPVLQDRPYTTLVAVHGHSWNGHIFKRLVPLATASNLRLVILNRRGYSASTPYSEDELITIYPNVVTEHRDMPVLEHSAFMQRRGVEIARFLAWFIEKEQIPPRTDSESGISGGISLLGWDLGNATTLSFLAFANTFDPTLITKLESYLRTIVIYDPPHHALGFPTPERSYNPLFDPELPAEQRQSKYLNWTSSYFIHSPTALDLTLSLRDPMDGLEQLTPDFLKISTIHNISPADLKVGLESGAAIEGDVFSLLPQAQPVHRDMRLRALFGNMNETSVPIAFPKVGVSYVWCTQSVWETVLAARLLRAEVALPPSYYYPARSIQFFPFDGNHYAHWDDPLRTLAWFASAIE